MMLVTVGRGVMAGVGVWLAAVVTGSTAMVVAQSPAPPTFHNDVVPILQKNCQTCHRPGQIAPMSLLTYEEARPWARSIKAKVIAREMPPWFADASHQPFANDRRLNDADLDTLVRWVDGGAAAGDPRDAPAPLQWPAGGWQIPPDIVVKGPETRVPASGIVEWMDVTVPSGLTADTWITSIELMPGDPAVTHHICVFIKPHKPDVEYNVPQAFDKPRDADGSELPRPKGQRGPVRTQLIGTNGNEFCYLPGNSVSDYRSYNAAKFVPAGADIVFALHYTPTGKEVVDIPRLGFTVAKIPPQRRFITYTLGATTDAESFAIPPGDPNWLSPPVNATFTEEAELVSMMPHMHVRGKDMTYRLDYPDGRSEIVLSVPNYDFNWQVDYNLARPIKMPKGTKLHVDAHYNNSAGNRHNPDPTRTVYWGDMTWEEMMSPILGVVVDVTVDPKQVLQRQAGTSSDGG